MRFLRPSVSLLTILGLFAPPTVARADEPAQSTPAPPAAELVPLWSHPQIRPTVFLHLDAASGINLEASSPNSNEWTFLCQAPCETDVPRDLVYRVNGAETRPSAGTSLWASPGESVRLTALPASQSAYTGGVSLVVLGSTLFLIGFVTALDGLFQTQGHLCVGSCPVGNPPASVGNPGVAWAGGIIAVVGAATAIPGIVLASRNASSHMRQAPLVRSSRPQADTTWLRAPVWGDSVKNGATGGNAGIPIFSGRF